MSIDPSTEAPETGSRLPRERRFPRFALDAPAEMVEPIQKMRFVGHTIEISEGGCFIAVTDGPAANLIVQLRIDKGGESFSTWARVVYKRSNSGVGLKFIATAPEDMKVLKIWLNRLERL